MLNRHVFLNIFVNLRCESVSLCRHYQDMLYPLFFLTMAIVLFPLSINVDLNFIRKMAAGVFWVIVLFSSILTLEQLFKEDWQEGELEQLILDPNNLLLTVLIKLIVFSLMIAIPLTIMAPILSLVFGIAWSALKTLVVSLWLGIPTLVFLGGIARVLTLGLRNSSVLIVLLVLPFYIPVLIFASSATSLASIGLAPNACLAWLAVLMILSTTFCPFVISAVLRLGISIP
ncbi:MAG: heme exporter protein CcmB [Rickettsiella sp.]|nr:heme exporter protein CcmB [Rickettsiella sp.]